MNENKGPVEQRPLVITDLVEKGGWQKPVQEPMLDARPMGMPPASPGHAQPQAGGGSGGAGGDQGAGGAGAQGSGDA